MRKVKFVSVFVLLVLLLSLVVNAVVAQGSPPPQVVPGLAPGVPDVIAEDMPLLPAPTDAPKLSPEA